MKTSVKLLDLLGMVTLPTVQHTNGSNLQYSRKCTEIVEAKHILDYIQNFALLLK
jgi:hypothetical protein